MVDPQIQAAAQFFINQLIPSHGYISILELLNPDGKNAFIEERNDGNKVQQVTALTLLHETDNEMNAVDPLPTSRKEIATLLFVKQLAGFYALDYACFTQLCMH